MARAVRLIETNARRGARGYATMSSPFLDAAGHGWYLQDRALGDGMLVVKLRAHSREADARAFDAKERLVVS